MSTARINEHEYDDLPTVLSMHDKSSISQLSLENYGFEIPGSIKTTPLRPYILINIAGLNPIFPKNRYLGAWFLKPLKYKELP